jgi:hypothetical protein
VTRFGEGKMALARTRIEDVGPGLISSLDLRLHEIQILLGIQRAWMNE